jgi:diguanylate cyclase (GGDEF)-like protein
MRKGRFAGLVRSASAPAEGATRAAGLLALAEQGGLAWFWETDALGNLAYVSPQLAAALNRGVEDLRGRPFAQLLLVEQADAERGERPAIGFHLDARFPFSNVAVRLNGSDSDERGWLLSGTPLFDEIGRFLGFRGFGTPLTAERQADARTARLASFDSLTGLPNRARMEHLLDEALANSDRRKQSCALFLIDLDRFKQVNDTLGHPVGDVLLQQVAARLSAVLGKEGEVGRLGGDEFEAVFPGIGEEGHLAALAERLISAVSAPYVIHGHQVSIGASVGIAISRPGRTYAKALVKEADLALYAAKRAGRGTLRFFEPEMHAEETDRKILENDLWSAVAKGQLRLLYQPIVSVSTESLVGFEALVRWWHPTRGPLAPADFLPIAGASGQIAALGAWIIRTACAQAATWPQHLRLAINLAAGQLEPGLADVVTGALAASGLAADRLELELREEALLGDDAAARDALSALHGLGVHLVLDDFGSGATSLLSLRTIPLDRIKLHPTLLRAALPENSRHRALAGALMRLARALDAKVTAEGAETLEDLQLIRALGCDDVQGFLFGRPVEPEEAHAVAVESKPFDPKEAAGQRPPRHSLIRLGQIRHASVQWPVRLRNISAGGAMVESGRDVAPGERIELDLAEGLVLAATVRWSCDGRLGLCFDQGFDLARLGKDRRAERSNAMSSMPDYLRQVAAPEPPRITIREKRRKT